MLVIIAETVFELCNECTKKIFAELLLDYTVIKFLLFLVLKFYFSIEIDL